MVHTVIGDAVFVATLAAIMARPFKLNEAIAAAAGAILMVVGGFIRPGEVLNVLAQAGRATLKDALAEAGRLPSVGHTARFVLDHSPTSVLLLRENSLPEA
jgi:hypothetical protein